MSHRYVHPEYTYGLTTGSAISSASSNSSIQASPYSSSNLNAQYSIPSQSSFPTLDTSVFPWGNTNVLNPPTIKNPLSQQTYSLPPYFRSISCCIPMSKEVQTNPRVPLGVR